MTHKMSKTAVLSNCEKYRYWLFRQWDERLPVLAWVMLNPSTADADSDDPTIRKCIGFARHNGYGGIAVLNLFAYRATNPLQLRRTTDPIGPDNDIWLRVHMYSGSDVVVAWGSNGTLGGRYRAVVRRMREKNVNLLCLGVTKGGQPRHPLYMSYRTKLVPYTF